MNYDDFLHTKVQVAPVSGFEVTVEQSCIVDRTQFCRFAPCTEAQAEEAEMENPSLFDLVEGL